MSVRASAFLAPLALLGLSLPGVALADHPYILPSSTILSGEGNSATFDAAGADHVFFFDHRPIQLASIRITRPDGSAGEPYNASQMRFRSVFDVRLDQPGTWKVASEQTMVIGTFKLDGEERRVGGRPGGMAGMGGAAPRGTAPPAGREAPGPGAPPPGEPRRQPPVALQDLPAGATDLHLIEQVGRTETFVTLGEPTNAVFRPSGHGLELAPITHPNAIAAGETARFRFLIDGRPAAGVAVTVLPGGDRYREEAKAQTLVTGADGTVAVTWPAAGMYWLGAEAEDHHPAEPRAEKRRMTYAATLEVMTP